MGNLCHALIDAREKNPALPLFVGSFIPTSCNQTNQAVAISCRDASCQAVAGFGHIVDDLSGIIVKP
jgi:hypothetical protein